MDDETIFNAALERASAAERAAFLDGACAGDPDKRRRIEELLAAHESRGILDRPAFGSELRRGVRETLAPDDAASPRATPRDDASVRPSPPRDEVSPGRVDHYELLETLGRGAFGTVVKARDERLQRIVAVKFLAPHLAASGSARKRFLREARAAAAVRDPHVVTVHAVSDDDHPTPYLVMEFVGGKTLQQKIDRSGPLSPRDALRIGAQIARGLAAAHATGLIHRDVKPANVLLENGVERVKLTDFGLARAADDASLTQPGVAAGTPLYMSPEQARGEPLDRRSDLFSLGSVLYTMCTGRAPFRAATTRGTLHLVCEERPRAVREIDPAVPAWLAGVIERLHAKDPADRYQSAREVAEVLTGCLADLELHGAVSPPAPTPTRRAASSATVAGGLAVAAGLAIVTTLALYGGGPLGGGSSGRSTDGPSRGDPSAPSGTAVETPFETVAPPRPTFTPDDERRLAALSGDAQVAALARELKRLNPDFDDRPQRVRGWLAPRPRFENGVLVGLGLDAAGATDLSPLRALRGLRSLLLAGDAFKGTALEDVSPLRGLPLEALSLAYHPRLSDVSPLAGTPLRHLDLSGTDVRDVEPLRAMPLSVALLLGAPVDDLSPLTGKRLERFSLTPSKIKRYSGVPLAWVGRLGCRILELPPDAELRRLGVRELELYSVDVKRDEARLRELRPLVKSIDWKPAGPIYEELDARRASLFPVLADPELERLAALPPADQIAAVSAALARLNPGWDGRLTGWRDAPSPRIEDGAVVEVGLDSTALTDLSPLRAFRRLRALSCTPSGPRGTLVDLSPLRGLPLEKFACPRNPGVTDLSPLVGAPLRILDASDTGVASLDPLAGAPLAELAVARTFVVDLAPLAEKRLTSLDVADASAPASSVSRWPPAAVERLSCRLAEAPSPDELRRLGVEELTLTGVEPRRDAARLRELRPWLRAIDGRPAADVFRTLDAAP